MRSPATKLHNFANDKKTFLAKLDKSKKGGLDEKIIPLINIINQKPNYYTTSSCSGRVYLWTGTGKKNETNWLKVSHDLINENFLTYPNSSSLIWLRFEPFIMHICCTDLETANNLLEQARNMYKKSCLLSISNKIIIEIRGSEFIEMPLYENNILLLNKDLTWLKELLNKKMLQMWQTTAKFQEIVKKI
ncbi:hypothetical protein HYX11_01775 [Candidatus Woesearchaeota archaeon]|nr:hypothetical protein [Candidatus Woesearchaeota archaeon]